MSRKYREILNKTQYLFNHQNLCCHLQRTPRLHTLGWSNRQILDNLQIEDPLYLMVCITYFREYRLLRDRLTNLVMLAYVRNLLSSEKNKRFPLFRVHFQVRRAPSFPVSNMLHQYKWFARCPSSEKSTI